MAGGSSSTRNNNSDVDLNWCKGKSNKELYKHENGLRAVMKTIGLARRERDRIVSNGFEDLDEIVAHHTHDVSGFVDYMKNLNKTFASASDPDVQVYFTPVTIQRFSGVLHYFNQAVNTFHTIPDPLSID